MVTSVRHPFVLRPKPGRLCSGAATLCGAVKVEEDELLYMQPHSCWKIFPQDLDSLKDIEISIFFMLWLQISMLAINYIYTPVKCNHCTLGEEKF